MKPNYKALAEEYRKMNLAAQEHISALLYEKVRHEKALREKEQELDDWMRRYVQVLNQLIDLQERVARKEE